MVKMSSKFYLVQQRECRQIAGVFQFAVICGGLVRLNRIHRSSH